MTGGVESAVRSVEHIVAEGEAGFIEFNEICVGKEILANADVKAVVAQERGNDFEAFAANLAINSCNSFIFSSFFLLDSFACFNAN